MSRKKEIKCNKAGWLTYNFKVITTDGSYLHSVECDKESLSEHLIGVHCREQFRSTGKLHAWQFLSIAPYVESVKDLVSVDSCQIIMFYKNA